MEGFPPPPPGGMADHEQMLEEKVRCDARFQHGCAVLIHIIPMVYLQAKKWQQMNSKRYASQRKFGYVQAPKEDMPPGKPCFQRYTEHYYTLYVMKL